MPHSIQNYGKYFKIEIFVNAEKLHMKCSHVTVVSVFGDLSTFRKTFDHRDKAAVVKLHFDLFSLYFTPVFVAICFKQSV